MKKSFIFPMLVISNILVMPSAQATVWDNVKKVTSATYEGAKFTTKLAFGLGKIGCGAVCGAVTVAAVKGMLTYPYLAADAESYSPLFNALALSGRAIQFAAGERKLSIFNNSLNTYVGRDSFEDVLLLNRFVLAVASGTATTCLISSGVNDIIGLAK